METIDLTTLLSLADGGLVFTADTVPDTGLAAQLSKLAGGSPVTISSATRVQEANAVRVNGFLKVLGQPDLPIALSAAVVPSPELLQLRAVIELQKLKKPQLLQDFWQQLSLPAPPKGSVPKEVALNDLTLEADKTGGFRLVATMAPAPGWPLDLGPAKLQLANVKLTVQKSGGSPTVSSRLSGELALGEALTLAMDCDTTGSFSLGAKLPSTTLRQLVKRITKQELPAVGIFDTSFDGGSIAINREEAGLFLTATGTVGGIGLVMQARRASAGEWGIALSLSLASNTSLNLPALEQMRQLCRLDSLVVVYTSYDNPGFQLASLVAPGNPAAGARLPLNGGLQSGLTAYASWKLSTDDKLRPLRKLLPQELAVLLHLNRELTGGRVAARVDFAFNNKTNDNPLTFAGQVGYELEAGSAGLFLSGSMQTRLPGQPDQPGNLVQFDVEGDFLPTGVLISGSMLGTATFGTLPVSLSNLGVVVGVNEASVPSVGLAGMLAVKDFQSSVAVFFDSTNPSRSMLAGSLSGLNLRKVLDTFSPNTAVPDDLKGILESVALTGTITVALPDGNKELATSLAARQLGKLADALRPQGVQITSDLSQAVLVAGSKDNKRSTWFLADASSSPPVHYELTSTGDTLTVRVNPQLYFAPQNTQIGRLQFGQGLFINAKLQILTYEALVNIKASLSDGLLIEGTINQPIVIGHEQFFSITAESDVTKGARVSVATYTTTYTPSLAEVVAATTKLQAWQLAQATSSQAVATAATKKIADALRGLGRGRAAGPEPVPPVLGPQPRIPVPAEVAPHFLLDGRATILGMRTGIYVEVNKSGFAFQVDDTPQRGVYVQLKGSFSGPTSLTAGGSLTVGLDGAPVDLGPLGRVALSTNVQGTLALEARPVPATGRNGLGGLAAPVRATARFTGAARALGQEVSFTLLFQVTGPSPLSVQQQVVGALADALRAALGKAVVWLDYVLRGLITGVAEASRVLVSEYKLKQAEVLGLYNQVNASAEQVGAALKNTFGIANPEEAAKVLKAANYTPEQVVGTLQTTYQVGNDRLQDVLTRAGYPAAVAKKTVETFVNTMSDTAKDFGNTIVQGGKGFIDKIL